MNKEPMFTLVPERVNYDQFWIEIRKRNLWLIKLRYGAVLMLLCLSFGLLLLHTFSPAFAFNTIPLWIVSSVILLYNLGFHKFWYVMPEIIEGDQKVHYLHFALIQIIVDFIALMLIIYYTGGIESPLYAFFIFHVVIGSLFLTGNVIRLLISFVLAITIIGSLLEANGVIAHHQINGLLSQPIYNNFHYMIVFFVVFGLSLFLSIYLANSIAGQLYMREKSLTKAYFALENAEKAKSKYVISVVHDLKTPIAAAMTHLNNMESGVFGDVPMGQQRPLERAKVRLNNAIETINDILRISQIRLEEDVEKVESINLKSMFENIASDLSELIESKKIHYSFKIDSKPDIYLEANPKLIKLALSNIVSNAIKYTDEGGDIEVIIEDHHNTFEISVTDSGMGIPEPDQEKIFQDFFRTVLSKKKNTEGTGLGMSIVLQIIKKYNGYIKVHSPSYLRKSPTQPGTQFIITIPKKFSMLAQTN